MIKRVFILSIFISNSFANIACGQNKDYIIKPVILKVYDGDTVLIKTKEGTASVRLTGIDCYETHFNSHIVYQKTEQNSYEEIFAKGEMAKLKLEQLVKNENIFLEITGMNKKYSRLVGILYTSDGMNINKEMLKNGLCMPYKYKSKTSN